MNWSTHFPMVPGFILFMIYKLIKIGLGLDYQYDSVADCICDLFDTICNNSGFGNLVIYETFEGFAGQIKEGFIRRYVGDL